MAEQPSKQPSDAEDQVELTGYGQQTVDEDDAPGQLRAGKPDDASSGRAATASAPPTDQGHLGHPTGAIDGNTGAHPARQGRKPGLSRGEQSATQTDSASRKADEIA